MSNHAHACPECGHELCEHTTLTYVPALLLEVGEGLLAVIQRAEETTQAEADLATLTRENNALRERHARTADQLRGVRSTMQATIDTLRERLAATEHERYLLQVNLTAARENPSATEEALNDKVEKVRDYVKTLRVQRKDLLQLVTDILFIIGEE